MGSEEKEGIIGIGVKRAVGCETVQKDRLLIAAILLRKIVQ